MRNPRLALPASVAAALLTTGAAFGVVNPFTETFSSSAANWSSASTFTPLTYPVSGGPDGSAYGSVRLGFAANTAGEQPIPFRGQSNFNSSGNAFVGDWLAAGVTTFSFAVRHNAPVAVDFFARFTAGATAGVVAVVGPSVQPNTWTTFSVAIDPSTPFIYEGSPALFNSTFTNVARVQVGLTIPAGLAGQAGPFDFDIDNVRIVPAPGAAAMIGCGLGLAGFRRRRR